MRGISNTGPHTMPRTPKGPNVILPKLSDNARIIFAENVMAALRKRGTIGRATFVKKNGDLRNIRFIISQSASYQAKLRREHKRTIRTYSARLTLTCTARRNARGKTSKPQWRRLSAPLTHSH